MHIHRLLRRAAAAASLTAVISCGGDPSSPSSAPTPTAPGSSACGGVAVGPLGCAKGMMNGTISGVAFAGGIPTGAATYTPVAAQPALALPAQDFIVIQGTSAELTSLTITARAKTGRADLGAGVVDQETRQPTVNNASLATRANGASSGQWNTNITGGSGSITLTQVSTTGASGSYSFTMVPQAGSGATGNRVVEGTFTVTF